MGVFENHVGSFDRLVFRHRPPPEPALAEPAQRFRFSRRTCTADNG
jgi:hypothetical protein